MQGQEEFSITTEPHDGCIALIVHGDLDELTADTLDQALIAIDDGQPVIVDLSAATFICSASIHVLTKERPQGRPAIVVPHGHITRVLDIVEVNRTNSIFIDRHTAVRNLSLGRLAETGYRR